MKVLNRIQPNKRIDKYKLNRAQTMIEGPPQKSQTEKDKKLSTLTKYKSIQYQKTQTIEKLNMFLLQEQGFITRQNNRYLMILDLSSIIDRGKKSLFIDAQANVVKIEEGLQKVQILQATQNIYRKRIEQLEQIIDVLNRHKQFFDMNRERIKEYVHLQEQIQELKEANEILEAELKEERYQIQLEKDDWKGKNNKLKNELTFQINNHFQTKQKLEEMKKLNARLQKRCERLESEKQKLKEGKLQEKRLLRESTITIDSVWLQSFPLNPQHCSNKNGNYSSLKKSVSLFRQFESRPLKKKTSQQQNQDIENRKRPKNSYINSVCVNNQIQEYVCEQMTEI